MPADITEHHLTVQRTARYYVLGSPSEAAERWFVLHGYGQLARYFVRPFAAIAGADRAVIAPEALSRFYVDEMREHDRVGASWMTKADREHEIGDYVAYLDALAADLGRTTEAAAACVLGFSQGAATASRWALLGATVVDRLVLWGGSLTHPLNPPPPRERLQQLDLTLVVGTDDEYISEARVAAEKARLDTHGIPHRTIRYDGGHRIDADVLERVMQPDA